VGLGIGCRWGQVRAVRVYRHTTLHVGSDACHRPVLIKEGSLWETRGACLTGLTVDPVWVC
jgi:hypothetical protein